ncbi:sigma-70 family RNA polymerase sigma factor [Sphingomonas sp. BIUV-7]|uniref:Sigma-70 family RNA polymerase sigma factor n=1 Tax=Sphingomonas natans TaxID=3063330 RepID=A0ABT8Y9E2_9SPHN|nr:sigma-70 family RNA polymerase sigma factor [Sphingomonas sp. BIUV-7]MDO6414956.1 sigma-70 family RNA polymerase sigma factor [Sphingomonas sp. BIUV-7]
MNELTAVAARRSAAAEETALHRALHGFVTGRLRDRCAGEDIVQETYVRLYDYRRTRTITDAAAFCFAVARNLVHDHFRRLRALPPGAELADDIACPQPRAEEVLDFRQRVDVLIGALRVMPPLRREIFLRRRLDGIPGRTIAGDLGMTPAAVEKHCTRALADLRHALERRGLAIGASA